MRSFPSRSTLLSGLTLLGWLLSSLAGWSQAIVNGSFEGPRGPARIPAGWEACGQGSSPDTQPGSWQVYTAPFHGHSYLSLICRGPKVPFPNLNERCQQQLEAPLLPGHCYQYTISLARSASFSGGNRLFTEAASLRVWGASAGCEYTELLWESGPVAHIQWETYGVLLAPKQQAYDYLLLEAAYAQPEPYSGNLLLDQFEFQGETPCFRVAFHGGQ